jgi:hypothetical protein
MNCPPSLPRRTLVMLIASVLIAHTALLMGAPSEFRTKPAPLTAFTTRAIAAPSAPSDPTTAAAEEAPAPLPRTPPMATVRAKPRAVANAPAHLPQPLPQPVTTHTPYSDSVLEIDRPLQHTDSAYIATNYVADGSNNGSNANNTTINTAAKPSTPGSHAAAVRLPGSRYLQYDVSGEAKKFPYSASADLLWTQDGSSYTARLAITAFLLGSRIQTSAGQLTAQGLAPQRFSDKLKTEVAAHFERDKGIVSFSANTPDAPLLPGAQDRLSVLLQLGSLLAGAPKRYPTGSSISIQTIGARDADDWRFTVGEEQTLALPEGEHKARKLSRIPQREHDVRVDVWLASDLAYLPVQLRLTQDSGDFVQLQLKSVATP